VKQSESQYEDHNAYKEALKLAQDWLRSNASQLSSNADAAGDVNAVSGRLHCVNDLITKKAEGSSRISCCLQRAAIVSKKSGLAGRQSIQAETELLQADWNKFETDLVNIKNRLEKALERWSEHNGNCRSLDDWIRSLEKTVKDLPTSCDQIQSVKKLEVSYLITPMFAK
jgi:chromosome segregation ATPase